MRIIHCDKCEKDISKAYTALTNDYRVFEFGAPMARKYFDLCGSCFANLVYFIQTWRAE